MKSPFPGMDPFLEGYLWPDVHNGLAFIIKEVLVPQLGNKYVARTEIRKETDTNPLEDITIMYPDVEVSKKLDTFNEPASSNYKSSAISPPTIKIPTTSPTKVNIPYLEIRKRNNNELVTVIEIFSPVNKRNPGLKSYRKKRDKLSKSKVHLLEIDLLRRGERPFSHPDLPNTHYIINLLRVNSKNTVVWDFNVNDRLPIIPVPLIEPDTDAKLDFGQILDTLYKRSAYHLSIEYKKTPPKPVFSDYFQSWISQLTEKVRY